MDALAARLGMGARHLRRLFMQHLGASPVTVAQTRRLHFAKRLLDESNLPMQQVAIASGFGSVRRFNACFLKTYGRSPSRLRKLRSQPATRENEYRFLLRFRPPLAWDSLLKFLAPRATPGVELVEHGAYLRTFSWHGETGWLEAALDPSANAIDLRIYNLQPRFLFQIVERVRSIFDLAADPDQYVGQFKRDPLLRARVSANPGLRVPGCWDGFELADRAILGQQVSVRGATTLAGRLVREFGTPVASVPGLSHLFPVSERLADADLSRIGLPRARAHSIRSLARAVCAGEISFSGIVNVEDFITRFCELPGIGAWTAQYVAMRALGEPDAFPGGDLGLLHATGIDNARKLEARAEAWRPWRAYAGMYLWQTTPQTVRKKGVTQNVRILRDHREPARAIAVGH